MRTGLALLLLAGASAFAGPYGYRHGPDYAIGGSRRAPRYLSRYYMGQRLHRNWASSYHRAIWHVKHFPAYAGHVRRIYAHAYPYGFPGSVYPDDVAYYAFAGYRPYCPVRLAPVLTSLSVAWSLDDPVFFGPAPEVDAIALPEIRTQSVGARFLVDS